MSAERMNLPRFAAVLLAGALVLGWLGLVLPARWASLALLAAAKAWAFLAGRDYVIPEDIQAVLPSVVGHRLREQADPAGHGGGALVQWLLREVPAL